MMLSRRVGCLAFGAMMAILAVIVVGSSSASASNVNGAAAAVDVTLTSADVAAAFPPPQSRATLSHPGVVVLPMRRSDGGNMKTRQRAAAGHPDYQRLEAHTAHAAHLMEEKRKALHTMGTPVPSPFTGCPFADFLIPVVIGKTTFGPLPKQSSASVRAASQAGRGPSGRNTDGDLAFCSLCRPSHRYR